MSFPAQPLPARQELLIAGQWVDVTNDDLVRDPIEITRGIPSEGVRADPTKVTTALRNPGGRWSPRNPMSPYYGLIGLNTQMRVVLDEADDDFGRTSSNGWGTSSSGHTWATSGGAASAYAVSAGVATIAINTVNSARVTALNVSLVDCDVSVTFKPGVVATGAGIQMSAALRYQDDNNMWMPTLIFQPGGTVDVVIVLRKAGVNSILGSASNIGSYTATSQYRMRANLHGRMMTVRAWDAINGTELTEWTVSGVDDGADAILAAGKVGTRMLLQTGNTNPLPVTVSTSNLDVIHHRVNAEIPVWPPRGDVSGNDVWVDIEAAGLLRRLGRSGYEASPLRRLISRNALLTAWADRPALYCSLEEGQGATQAGSGLEGGTALTVTGEINWASVETVPGSAALPNMLNSAGSLTGTIPPPDTPTGTWTVGAVLAPVSLSATWTALAWTTAGGTTYNRFELRVTAAGDIELWASTGGALSLLGSHDGFDIIGTPKYVIAYAEVIAGDTLLRVMLYDDIGQQFNIISVNVGVVNAGYPAAITLTATGAGGNDVAGTGHVGAWHREIATGFTPLELLQDAVRAHAGELAHVRIRRLLEEDAAPILIIGDESEPAGPQRTAPTLDLIDDCIAVDKGLLYEARQELALVYRTRSSRYNLPVTLALDYEAPGHIAPPFEPVEDDQVIVNDLTITREGGSSARYEKTSGPRSVLPPDQGGAGRVRQSKTLQLANDSQPYQHATWEVHVATWDEARFAAVRVNMTAAAMHDPAILEQAKRLDVGDRMTIDNPPEWLPPDLIDLHDLGLSETIGGGSGIGTHAWEIVANTVPAGPYQVGIAGDVDDIGAWSQTGDGTKLVSSLGAGATSALAWSDGPVFTTDSAELVYSPLSVVFGGEVCPVSSIASVLLDTFTRSVSNGWGTANTGQAWTSSGGAAADYDANGSVARISNGSVNVMRFQTVPLGSADAEIVADSILPVTPTGASITRWLLLRYSDANNHHGARLTVDTAGAATLQLIKRSGGFLSTIGSSIALGAAGAGSTWRVRFRVEGQTLYASAWLASASEPLMWQLTQVDTSLGSGTMAAVATRLETGNTNTLPVVISHDNIEAVNPQRIVVTRTLPKAHAAGAPFAVYRPLVAAL